MSDTLKSDLNGVISALLEAGLGLGSTHVAAVEKAIAELDRLEAEVKKPRLPEGYDIVLRDDGNIDLAYEGQFGEWAAVIYSNQAVFRLLSAFLTTPDVVPSTEPVQAAGDTAARKELNMGHLDQCNKLATDIRRIGEIAAEMGHTDTLGYEQAREMILEIVAPLETPTPPAPAEVPNQDKGYQTPMNTETAEKPKPVSLVERYMEWAHRQGTRIADEARAEDFMWLLRTLDQARGV